MDLKSEAFISAFIEILLMFFEGGFNKKSYLFPQLGFWHPFEKLVLANCELIQF